MLESPGFGFGAQAPSFNPSSSCRGVDKHMGGWSGSGIAVTETKQVMDLV